MGNYSVSMGVNNNAANDYSFTAGTGNTALGAAGIAMGNFTQSRNTGSVAIGNSLISKVVYGTVLGSNNDTTDVQRPIGSSNTDDRILQIGNGSSNSRSNAITVLQNGNTGVGVLNPIYKFEVSNRMRIRSGGIAAESAGIWLNNLANNNTPAFMGMFADNLVGFYGSGTGWGLTMNTSNANIGIGLNGANPLRPISFPATLGENIIISRC